VAGPKAKALGWPLNVRSPHVLQTCVRRMCCVVAFHRCRPRSPRTPPRVPWLCCNRHLKSTGLTSDPASFIARPPITSSRVSGGSIFHAAEQSGGTQVSCLKLWPPYRRPSFGGTGSARGRRKNISRADRRHAEGSRCCCLLPHHPHRRHHPARRQCPCNCDARTPFSGRAKKKRRGRLGVLPRRLEAVDVQCSRSMHRND
jgi:hypothetical protein